MVPVHPTYQGARPGSPASSRVAMETLRLTASMTSSGEWLGMFVPQPLMSTTLPYLTEGGTKIDEHGGATSSRRSTIGPNEPCSMANLEIRTVRTKMTPHGYDSNVGSTPRAALPLTLADRQQLLGRPSVSSRLTVLGPSDVARQSHTARALLARSRVPRRTKWRGCPGVLQVVLGQRPMQYHGSEDAVAHARILTSLDGGGLILCRSRSRWRDVVFSSAREVKRKKENEYKIEAVDITLCTDSSQQMHVDLMALCERKKG
ncbi:hypothetical protein J8273_2180 [Carpediemonas membranifera]|uniref:Uncharacterized protein n=1 Tax=Carpediemonas membranifera TaxID=201153 RepID=A0A8J6BA52_9EUKA|nr:hypothetical protein J8273_2180 [Carpediemonas membranifera]|eukprot:KAG9396449.1 hypothetical protein J8273_2180 [Carpediemonas membranifera]